MINYCETIRPFSENEGLTHKENLSPFLEGKSNPTPGLHGYMLCYHLTDDSLILNLFFGHAPLQTRVGEKFGKEGIEVLWKTITSRKVEERKATQVIAVEARRRGFDGIFYRSVRAPKDVNYSEENLVVFSPDKLRSGPAPRERFPRAGAAYVAWLDSHNL
jgi:hypothetical protein